MASRSNQALGKYSPRARAASNSYTAAAISLWFIASTSSELGEQRFCVFEIGR